MFSFSAPVKTPKQLLKECQSDIRQAVREIERAQKDLIKKEEQRQREIKEMARKGQMPTVRVMAKDIARMRGAIAKFYSTKVELESVSSNLVLMTSTAAMADAMKTATRAMMRMNAVQTLPALQKVLQRFAKEQDMLEMKQESMNDAMSDAMDGDGEEEDEVVNRVLDELGIDVASTMGDAPDRVPSSGLPKELANRLEDLKK
jgi:charged multivesicular body protein 2A